MKPDPILKPGTKPESPHTPATAAPATPEVTPEEKPKASPGTTPHVLPKHVSDQGWKEIEARNLPKIFYGIRKEGSNFQAIRIEVLPDGSVHASALPANLKMIAIERTLDIMSQETA